jgi:Protein of unknown function (DUF2911)
MSAFFKFSLSFITIFVLLLTSAQAQLKYPQLSPGAKATQTVGITDITISYHRPGVKGRVIWGGLVPYNEIWRTGANESTTIEFSDEVSIAGTKVSAGKYSLFTIPALEEWTVVINKNPNGWGAYGYKQEEDLLRFKVKPEMAEHQEWMMFTFENLSKNGVDLVLRWEKVKVSVPISVNTDELVLKGAKADLGWRSAYQAASYCLDNNVSVEDGKKWNDQSLAVEQNYWNLTLKARYLALDKNFKEATKTLQKALDLGQKMENKPMNYADMEKLMQEWKK